MDICKFIGSRRIGPPRNWDATLDGDCVDIHVLDSVDTLSGLPVMFTFFKPSTAELEALAAGGVIRLGIVGMRQHTVFNLGVLTSGTAEMVAMTPDGSLGDDVIA